MVAGTLSQPGVNGRLAHAGVESDSTLGAGSLSSGVTARAGICWDTQCLCLWPASPKVSAPPLVSDRVGSSFLRVDSLLKKLGFGAGLSPAAHCEIFDHQF